MSADLDFGKLAFKFQGEFDFSMQYEKLDCVYYDFSTYLAINTPIVGEEPSSSSDWVLMCQGYGLASEQEVVEGVVDNKAVSPLSLRFNSGFFYPLFEDVVSNNNQAKTWTVPDYYGDGLSYPIYVELKAGGGGAGTLYNDSNIRQGCAGGEGETRFFYLEVIPNQAINYIVGTGGLKKTNIGDDGANSSFATITAYGGQGGRAHVRNDTMRSAGGGAGFTDSISNRIIGKSGALCILAGDPTIYGVAITGSCALGGGCFVGPIISKGIFGQGGCCVNGGTDIAGSLQYSQSGGDGYLVIYARPKELI